MPAKSKVRPLGQKAVIRPATQLILRPVIVVPPVAPAPPRQIR